MRLNDYIFTMPNAPKTGQIDARHVDLRTDVPCITSCTRAAVRPPTDAMRRIYAAGIAPVSADIFRNITST